MRCLQGHGIPGGRPAASGRTEDLPSALQAAPRQRPVEVFVAQLLADQIDRCHARQPAPDPPLLASVMGDSPVAGGSCAAGQLSKGGDYLRRMVGLGQETAAFRQIAFTDADEAGGRNDLDRGHRPLTNLASFSPSMEPGICTSVNTTCMSGRASSMAIASSAFAASTTSKPASPIISAAFIRSRKSSSTIRTTGRLIGEISMTRPLPTLSKCVGKDSFREKGMLQTGAPFATCMIQPAYGGPFSRIKSRITSLPKARAALSSASIMRPTVSWSPPSAL
jgi:hypothetical protein